MFALEIREDESGGRSLVGLVGARCSTLSCQQMIACAHSPHFVSISSFLHGNEFTSPVSILSCMHDVQPRCSLPSARREPSARNITNATSKRHP